MKKRTLFSLVSAGLLTVALASCGGSSASQTTTSTVPPTQGEVDMDQATLINEAYNSLKSGKAVTFEFWHSFGDAIAGELEDLVNQFNTEMKTKGFNITVKVVNKGGGYDGLRQSVNLGVPSKTIPTLVLGYPDHFADYIKQDLITPLDAFVYNENSEIALDGVSKESNDFVASYWAENQMFIKDAIYTAGVPFNKSTEIMCYNSSMVDPILEKLGYLDEGATWQNPTWDEVFAVGKYIIDNKATLSYTYNGGSYKVSNDMAYPVYIDSEANFFITTSRQWGGDGKYTVAEGTAGKLVAWNDSTKAAMEYFLPKALTEKVVQLPKAGGTGSYGSSYMAVNKAFISIGSTAGVKNNDSASYFMKATSIPQKAGSENKAVIQQGTNLTILSKHSSIEQQVAAWLLTKYLTSTDVQVEFSTNTGYLPVRNSSRDSEGFKELIASANPEHPSYLFDGAVAKGVIAAIAQQDYYFTDPAFSGSSVIRDSVATAMEDMFLFKKTYDQAMNTLYTSVAKYGIKCEKK